MRAAQSVQIRSQVGRPAFAPVASLSCKVMGALLSCHYPPYVSHASQKQRSMQLQSAPTQLQGKLQHKRDVGGRCKNIAILQVPFPGAQATKAKMSDSVSWYSQLNNQLTDGGPSEAPELAIGLAGPPFGAAPGSALCNNRRSKGIDINANTATTANCTIVFDH